MTCARVRPFESKPPPQGTSKPNVPETPRPKSTEKPGEESPDSKPKTYFRTQTGEEDKQVLSVLCVLLCVATLTSDLCCAEHLARCRSIPHKAGLRKQMEIQSLCEWHNDRKRVVESLTRRMFQDKLPRRFPLGPYRVCLVSKTFLKKPSGSTLIYKVGLSASYRLSVQSRSKADQQPLTGRRSPPSHRCASVNPQRAKTSRTKMMMRARMRTLMN